MEEEEEGRLSGEAKLPRDLPNLDDAAVLVTLEALRGELQQFAEQTLRPCLHEILPRISDTIEREVLKHAELITASRGTGSRETGSRESARIRPYGTGTESAGSICSFRPRLAGSAIVREEMKEELEGIARSRNLEVARAEACAEDGRPKLERKFSRLSCVTRGPYRQSTLVKSTKTEECIDELAAGDANPSPATAASGKEARIEEGSCQQRALSIVERPQFEKAVIIIIVFNAIFIAMETDYHARNLDMEKAGVEWIIVEYFFLLLFVTELALRFVAYRRDFFKVTLEDGRRNRLHFWNYLDLFIIVLQCVTSIRSHMVSTGNSFSLLRILRLTRLVRIFKVLALVRDLRVIVYSIMRSCSIFIWSVIALLLMTFMFSCFFTELVHGFRSGDEQPLNDVELNDYFGSMPKTMLTLYQAISGGIDWRDLTNILEEMPFSGQVPLVGYVSFALLAMMNVITGVFLESAIDKARDEREIYLARHASDIFQKADTDKTGLISWEEFETAVRRNPSVQHFFKAIDIDHTEAESLFKLLDDSGDGQISAEEFLQGCMRVNGPAKSLDLLVLTREVQQLFEQQGALLQTSIRPADEVDKLPKVEHGASEDSKEDGAKVTPVTSLHRHRLCRNQSWSAVPPGAERYSNSQRMFDPFDALRRAANAESALFLASSAASLPSPSARHLGLGNVPVEEAG